MLQIRNNLSTTRNNCFKLVRIAIKKYLSKQHNWFAITQTTQFCGSTIAFLACKRETKNEDFYTDDKQKRLKNFRVNQPKMGFSN